MRAERMKTGNFDVFVFVTYETEIEKRYIGKSYSSAEDIKIVVWNCSRT